MVRFCKQKVCCESYKNLEEYLIVNFILRNMISVFHLYNNLSFKRKIGDECVIQIATVEDKKTIYELLKNSYFPDMPLYAALNVKKSATIDKWPELETLDRNLTLKAVTPEGEIVGVAINLIPQNDVVLPSCEGLGEFFQYVDNVSNGLLSDLEKTTMELRIIAVAKQWRGKGIATRLVEGSENLAKKHDQQSIYSIATGCFIEACLKSQNWKCIYRLSYSEYAMKNKKFTIPPSPDDSTTLYLKKIL